jgi:predicted GNAT family N-acyltransferase
VTEVVVHNSAAYQAAVDLRRRVLRIPLGLDFDEQELAQEASQVHFVSFAEGAVIACLTLVPNGETVKMRQVAVAPEVQGQGRGRALVEYSETWATEQGYAEINLHARESAIPFYSALGYQITSESFEEVGLPHRAMRKLLRTS